MTKEAPESAQWRLLRPWLHSLSSQRLRAFPVPRDASLRWRLVLGAMGKCEPGSPFLNMPHTCAFSTLRDTGRRETCQPLHSFPTLPATETAFYPRRPYCCPRTAAPEGHCGTGSTWRLMPLSSDLSVLFPPKPHPQEDPETPPVGEEYGSGNDSQVTLTGRQTL